MNKTQKGAWFNVAGILLVLALGLYFTIQVGIRNSLLEGLWRYIWLPAFILITIIGIFFIHRKQSPVEPDTDERDNQIKQRSVLAAFVSVWIVLIAASVIPRFIVGADGSVPVWLLPIINICVFYIVFLVYSVAVLIQYGRGGSDGEE